MPLQRRTSGVSTKVRSEGLVRAWLLALLAIATASCGETRPAASASGGADATTCVVCHGDASRSPAAIAPAPPRDTKGNAATSAPGVGAHQRHLTGGSIRGAIECSECHHVPTTMEHASQPLDMTWGSLASARGASPSFNATSLTCANYCHGMATGGGTNTSPVWNKVDGTQAACGACHGLPPEAPHPVVDSIGGCVNCHAGTVNADGSIKLSGGLHVNGVVEISGSGGSCTSCHGDPSLEPASFAAAPPIDTRGNTAISSPGVGAHQRHLRGGRFRGPLECNACHVVPTDLAHAREPLDLTWGPLARADGAVPTYDRAAHTCSNYCHGSTIQAPALLDVVWTLPGKGQVACGACHGLPPPSPHPQFPASMTVCNGCHAGTVDSNGVINVAGGLHVNGVVDISGGGGSGSCTGCHGDASRSPASISAAPPNGTRGETATSQPAVGAHQRHLLGGNVRGPLACTDCHVVPADLAHAGQPLQLTWGSLARTGGAVPTWNGASFTCANYCHGATLTGGSLTAPVWNKVDGSQAACGTCHGLPPAGAHPQVGSSLSGCATCHAETVTPDGAINVAGGKHVDGVLQASGHGNFTSPAIHGPAFLDAIAVNPAAPSCTSCHGLGYDGTGGAPSCNACHVAAGWATPWQSNCSFCHGTRSASTQSGYAVNQHPAWAAPPDDVNGRLGGTNSPSRTGAHQAHLTGVMAGGSSIASPFACETCHALPSDLSHVDGSAARAVVALTGAGQASLPAGLGSFDPASGTCTTYCHGSTLHGGTVASPEWSRTDGTQAACGSCHGVPPAGGGHPFVSQALTGCYLCHPDTMNANGTLNVAGGRHVDGVIQVSGGHGDYTAPSVHAPRFFDFVSGAAGALQCTLCHGADYGTVVTASGDSCNTCHQKAGWTGWTTNCSFCHGSRSAQSQAGYVFSAHPGWASPPDDLSGRLVGANLPARTGAHQAHLNGTTSSGATFALPFSCTTCHAVPTDLTHISGSSARAAVILAGAGQASLPSSLGTYSQGAGTCATYCHGPATSPAWSAAGVVCGSCHALPPAPSTGHPSASGLASCTTCHPDTMNADGTLHVAGGRHLNGVIDVTGGHADIALPSQHGPMALDHLGGVTGALDCTTCHGADYGRVITTSGDSCNTCHQKAGWTGWTTNCSFCHGARNAQSRAGYSVAAYPTLSAPPDDVQGRLTGNNLAARTGAHQPHLTGTSASGQSYAPPFACATCHAVPSSLAHINGSTARATVTLSGAGQGSLPANLGSFNPVTGTCTTYCHGSTISATPPPAWSGGPIGCTGCHGYPPGTGQHDMHVVGNGNWCADCHAGTVDFSSTIIGTAHLNGTRDVQFFSPGSIWSGGSCSSNCHEGSEYRSW